MIREHVAKVVSQKTIMSSGRETSSIGMSLVPEEIGEQWT